MSRDEIAGSALCKALYIHIPFCRSKCLYCDFNSYAGLDLSEQRYVDSLIREFDHCLETGLFARSIESLYIGGGTPSLLSLTSIDRLVSHIKGSLELAGGFEATIEVNPTSVDSAKLDGYLAIGINRISLGIQSFNDAELLVLGRTHSAKEAAGSFKTAREAGFDNISVDLIYGIPGGISGGIPGDIPGAVPGQSVDSFRTSLEKAIELSPEHISLYGLTYEEGTPIFNALNAGQLERVDEDIEREMYLSAIELLNRAGYEHYEISNFALPGREARHNSGYWSGRSYIGLGAGAHSCSFGDSTKRWWNENGVEGYMRLVNERGDARAGEEALTLDQEKMEAVYLGLRVLKGIDTGAFRARFGSDPMDFLGKAALDNELLTMDESGVLRFTQKGLLFSDSIF